ncbi:peptidoglycan DD-metalloendopeptidase family protein [Virgibacillus sp. W0430]|uniref:peptidoglycan DD-metalloendopeptidase family protein n=1 Tax=Virgibacillus sp. W0430 TaxID=3391580 RepID=UPI003F461BA0
MDRGVNKVREKIKQRKKLRHSQTNHRAQKQMRQIHPGIVQEEEKHGYYPSVMDQPIASQSERNRLSGMFMKAILSIVLFFGTAWILEANAEYMENPKYWTVTALTEEFPFARVNKWYQTTFGTPLAFTPSDSNEGILSTDQAAMPVDGRLEQTFQSNGEGIMISPKETAHVSSIKEGIVIFAGNDREMGKTVIVQHPDNSKSTYGHLSAIHVHLYQYVNKNHSVGAFQPTVETKTVFFSIEKDKQFIDPIQVIPVDDLQ